MQKKNKLNKICVAVFTVTCCILCFALHGRIVSASSPETPSTEPTFVSEFFRDPDLRDLGFRDFEGTYGLC